MNRKFQKKVVVDEEAMIDIDVFSFRIIEDGYRPFVCFYIKSIKNKNDFDILKIYDHRNCTLIAAKEVANNIIGLRGNLYDRIDLYKENHSAQKIKISNAVKGLARVVIKDRVSNRFSVYINLFPIEKKESTALFFSRTCVQTIHAGVRIEENNSIWSWVGHLPNSTNLHTNVVLFGLTSEKNKLCFIQYGSINGGKNLIVAGSKVSRRG